MTRALEPPWPPALSPWLLVGSGMLTGVAGVIWWAWDAEPSWGQILLIAGMLVAAAGYVTTRRQPPAKRRGVAVAAAFVLLFASYELWRAIAAIESQAASHLA